MAAQSRKGGGWLKYGCLGCLGVVVFLILIVAGVAGIALMQVRSEEVAETTLSPEIPEPPAPPPPDGPVPTPDGEVPSLAAGGRVFLELAGGEFTVEPGKPGERLHVEASYDKSQFRLEEVLETPENGPWVYRVAFRRTGTSGFMSFFRALMGGSTPRVLVLLPGDIPIELEGRMGQGGAEMELGGLWLTRATLRFEQGGAMVTVSEPLREPMERLVLSGAMGGLATRSLGNASPRSLEVDFRMGGVELDLRGAWRNDADVRIDTSMAGGAVRLPRDVLVEGLDRFNVSRPDLRSTAELPVPTLRFSVSESMGELEFR